MSKLVSISAVLGTAMSSAIRGCLADGLSAFLGGGFGWLYDAAEFLSVQDYVNVVRWADQIFARPAVARGRKVNRMSGTPSSQLHERHDASDFNTRTQDKLMGEQA